MPVVLGSRDASSHPGTLSRSYLTQSRLKQEERNGSRSRGDIHKLSRDEMTCAQFRPYGQDRILRHPKFLDLVLWVDAGTCEVT